MLEKDITKDEIAEIYNKLANIKDTNDKKSYEENLIKLKKLEEEAIQKMEEYHKEHTSLDFIAYKRVARKINKIIKKYGH